MTMRRAKALTLAISGVAGLPVAAQASTVTWANVSTNWPTGSNWVGGTAPADDLITDVAYLPAVTTASLKTPAISGTVNVNGLIVDNSIGVYGNFGGTLNLGSGGLAVSGAAYSMGSATYLGAEQTWNVATGATLTLTQGLKSLSNGSYSLVKTGNGMLSLTGGTYAAGTWQRHGTNTISEGILKATKASALGDGTTTVNNIAELQITQVYDSGAALPQVILNDSSTLTFLPGSGNAGFVGPQVGSGATVSIHTSTNAIDLATVGTNFSGGGTGSSITISGNGAMTLTDGSGTPVYSGSWTINSGVVRTRWGRATFGYSTNPIYLNGGTLASDHGQGATGDSISQTITVGGNATVQSDSYYTGGADKRPSGSFTFGALNIGAYTLTANINPNNTALAGGGTNLIFGNTTLTGNATFQVDNPGYSGGYTTTLDLGTVGGGYSLTKTGGGILRLSGTAHTYSGATNISAGTLAIKAGGSIANSPVINVANGAILDVSALSSFSLGNTQILSGSGEVKGTVGGSGAINPGNSAGILTATRVSPTNGLDLNLEFAAASPAYNNATASGNDLIRLTDTASPFTADLTSANAINVYFDLAGLATGPVAGGIFTDQAGDFLSSIQNATFTYYYKDPGGTYTYNGENYSLLDSSRVSGISTVAAAADFGSGAINGQVLQFSLVVPEPVAITVVGLAAPLLLMRRRRVM